MKKNYLGYSRIPIFLGILIVLVLKTNLNVLASDDLLGFTYNNVTPKNQIGDHDYFELQVKPGDKQTLITKVTNTTNKKQQIQIHISDATTSPSGNINYGPSKEKLLGKNTPCLTDMIKAPSKIDLKPKETKEIKLKLSVPKKEFDGIVLGGVQLKEFIEKEEKTKNKKAATLSNEYSYIYSISLIENQKKIKPSLTSSGAHYNGMAYQTINNIQPMIASDIKIESLLKPEDSEKVLDSFKFDNYRIAPNSKLNLAFEETDNLALGKYQLETVVSIEGKKWHFNDKFEVTKENKNKKNIYFDDDTKNKRVNWIVIIFLIMSFILTTGIIFYILNRKNKKRINKK